MKEKGAYLLIVELSESSEKWGLEPGIYAYVGSAWGPGGLIARVKRHLLRAFKRPKWHIDHLTSVGRPLIAFIYPQMTEDELYSIVSRRLSPAVRGFGSTDTKHYTHLFKVDDVRALEALWRGTEEMRESVNSGGSSSRGET